MTVSPFSSISIVSLKASTLGWRSCPYREAQYLQCRLHRDKCSITLACCPPVGTLQNIRVALRGGSYHFQPPDAISGSLQFWVAWAVGRYPEYGDWCLIFL